jgi:predicted enzyme related to lactoylglutathione lyase
MPTVTQHAPGTFCWPELATLDQNGAKAYYTALLGWTVNDHDMGPQGVYTVFQSDGADVAALYSMRDEEKKMGPPHWNAYVSVESADQAAAKAKQLGGTVIAEPFDVMDLGRMAVLQDPTGAFFEVWEGRKNIGVGKLDEPGALCWTELMTRDAARAADFYTRLLSWKTEKMQGVTGADYTVFKRGEKSAAGMMPMGPEMKEVPVHWLSYFMVQDCDAAVAKSQSLGGGLIMPGQNIPGTGRFAILKDPQGAPFGILGPETK